MTDDTTDEPPAATVSTHVLDAALGRPAADLGLSLLSPDGDMVASLRTDADGRARLPDVAGGVWTLTFASGPWFAAQDRPTFYPSIDVRFEATAGEHHHVALLLSPFAYTTYRGS